MSKDLAGLTAPTSRSADRSAIRTKPQLDQETFMTIKITPNDKGNPPGKLADAELHFTEGPLDGLKLIAFSIWERRGGNGRNVTFPARQYTVNGERRAFALLRPIVNLAAQTRIRDLILDAYQQYGRARGDLMSDDQKNGRALPPTDLFSAQSSWNTR
jgi:hypothetical protein